MAFRAESVPRARSRRLIAIAVAGVLGGTLAGCGATHPGPQTTVTRYLSAWEQGDFSGMRALVADPPRDFTAVNAQVFTALGVRDAAFLAGTPVVGRGPRADRATVQVHARYVIPQVGTWSPTSTLSLIRRDGVWRVAWNPQAIDPSLQRGETIARSTVWPARGRILGAGGTPLTRSGTTITVGVVGSRIKDAAAVRADLLAAGAPATAVTQALSAAGAHPADFEPVFTVSEARFQHLQAAKGPMNVYAVPGTSFVPNTATTAATAQLAEHLVGTLGPITVAELKTLGAPYDAESVVGQSGLQQSQQRVLAGTPAVHLDVDDPGGNPIVRLATFPGRPGRDVRTTIDLRVQRAAEAALAHAPHPTVAMVALSAHTGQVLAAVSDPLTTYDTALLGAYPPGSTFKVLTSTALFRRGLTRGSPASCPPTVTVDGETFHNAGDEAATPTITQAFIESCNTAFIGLAVQHLAAADFPAAAALYGLNASPRLGVGGFYANVLRPGGRTQLAGDAIGQGNITFSPLGMATVAAAVASGVVRAPTLVQGFGSSAAIRSLPASVIGNLRPMMAGVVQSGTAAGFGLPAGTHAKTGTAEYGTGAEATQKIDGWLMGYSHGIAFAIVTQNTGGTDGGPIDAPLIARFFKALGD